MLGIIDYHQVSADSLKEPGGPCAPIEIAWASHQIDINATCSHLYVNLQLDYQWDLFLLRL
jgi:hypothetical protein